ncbi:hypothetical protein CASFOL_001328 [Castilleja foliolosa]|uniref:KIB1-4 beta-propeller domain-containing protein n=1 Tax=Castilleja foliolosa TaxID=1961234 RepID=A0ABD3EMT8_9LAMI
MASLVKRSWATGFSLLRRISAGSVSPSRYFADRKLGVHMTTMMMSTGVDSRIMSPWLMLPPLIEDGGDTVYKFYNLSEDKEESFRRNSQEEMAEDDAELVGSSHGWLALFNRRNNNHIFLYNPITRRHIKLPPIETLHDPMINLTRVSSVSKLILSSSPDDDDIVYSCTQKLLFCQTLMSTLELDCWDLSNSLYPRIHSSWELCWSDFHSNWLVGKYFARTQVNLVYSEEYNQLFIVMRYVLERMRPDGSFAYPIYFGKSRGWDNRYPYRTIGFDAYKFDFGVGKTQLVEGSLDGLSMFIGINHSIAMSITPQLKLMQRTWLGRILYQISLIQRIPKLTEIEEPSFFINNQSISNINAENILNSKILACRKGNLKRKGV